MLDTHSHNFKPGDRVIELAHNILGTVGEGKSPWAITVVFDEPLDTTEAPNYAPNYAWGYHATTDLLAPAPEVKKPTYDELVAQVAHLSAQLHTATEALLRMQGGMGRSTAPYITCACNAIAEMVARSCPDTK